MKTPSTTPNSGKWLARIYERTGLQPLPPPDVESPAELLQCWASLSRMVENLGCLYLIEVARVGRILDRTIRHASNLRNGYDPPTSDRHGRRLAAAAPATGHHLSPCGKPRPQSPPPGRRLRLTDTERRRLAALAHPIGRTHLKAMATLVTPDTLMRWYRQLIARKFDGSQHRQRLGRPPVAEEIERLTVQMAEENPRWGYRRIQGTLANLEHCIDAITVRNILRHHHMEPAPQRRKAGMCWTQFLKQHGEVLAATDFFTVEVATWHGLATYYVLVVMELATRRVEIAGITPHPTDAFMVQCARQLTDPLEGFLLGKRYLLHDRDTKYTQAFDAFLKDSGIEPVLLPPRSPNLNAYCERFIRSIKEEALEQMLMLGERFLYHVIRQYLAHYHTERNHQGLGNQLITPEPARNDQGGAVVRRDRLGGLLGYYYRDAA